MIIDDEPKIRKGLSKIISMHPGWYVPETFADGESAIEYLTHAETDVIITDMLAACGSSETETTAADNGGKTAADVKIVLLLPGEIND